MVVAGGVVAVLALGAIVWLRPASEWTAGSAPAANVAADHWTSGDKDAIGTAYDRRSNVWFTAVHGTLADVLYPTVDTDNLRQLGYLVTDGSTFFFDASAQGLASSKVIDDRALAYEMQVTDPAHHFTVVSDVATDPARPVVVVRTHVEGSVANLRVYAYLVPHLDGSGAGQQAFFVGDTGYVSKAATWLAVRDDRPMGPRTAGYLGRGDGYDQLHSDVLSRRYQSAGPGRVTLTWQIPSSGVTTTALAFGGSRAAASAALDATLKAGSSAIFAAYRDGWRAYASRLTAPPGAAPLFYYSADVIKMAEDKLHPGAIVASLARPWGETAPDGDGDVGYRKVWPRDLYHAASGLLAAGDTATAEDVLRFMGKQQLPDGSMPQNTDLEGREVWKAQQLDETADAVLLAVRLSGQASGPDVEKAVSYIVAHGPATEQERWEEAGGYSPATIAAEIAALRAAQRWEAANHVTVDRVRPLQAVVDEWDRSLESWTFTRTGSLGPGYYLRISADGKPDAAEPMSIANGGGVWDQREIVDPSFLELVRLGVRRPGDPRILATLKIVDSADSPHAFAWYRYPHDGYGEKNAGDAPPGQGHVWPLLTGERGVYTVLAGGDGRPYLDAMSAAASDGLIGEQVWEEGGGPTGSARPLVWAHAEYVILAKAVATGTVDDLPH